MKKFVYPYLKNIRGFPYATLIAILLILGVYGIVIAAPRLYPSAGNQGAGTYFYGGGGMTYSGTGAYVVGDGETAYMDFAGTSLYWGDTGWPCNSGTRHFNMYVDGGYYQDAVHNDGNGGHWTGLPAGFHTLMVEADGSACYIGTVQAFGEWDSTPPTNPTFKDEIHSLVSGTKTNVHPPTIEWIPSTDAESGVDHYNICWSNSPSCTTATSTTTSTSYTPTSPADGTWYLRVQAVNGVSLTSSWVDMFTYPLDTTPPSPVTTATETHGVITNTWQHLVPAPAFMWTKPPESDFHNYLIYFGTNASGTSTTSISTESFSPGTQVDGIYYLRLASQDDVGNTSAWNTVFIFKVDTVPPGVAPAATETHGITSDTWQNTVSQGSFSWTAPTDALSGYAGIRLYWGTDPAGTTSDALANLVSYNVAVATTPGTYYLRGQTEDNAGNQSTWTTMFIDRFDNTPPVWTGNAQEASGAETGTCQSKVTKPDFSFWPIPTTDAAPILKYQLYFGIDSSGSSPDVVYVNHYTVNTDTPENVHYFLRLNAIDTAGNETGFRTEFDWCYAKPAFPIIFIWPTAMPTATIVPTATSEPVVIPKAVAQPTSAPIIPTAVPTAIPTQAAIVVATVEPTPPPPPPDPIEPWGAATIFGLSGVFALIVGLDKRSVAWEGLAKTLEDLKDFHYPEDNPHA